MKIKTEIVNQIDWLELLFHRLDSSSQKEITPSLCNSKPWVINWLNFYLNKANHLFVCVQQTDDLLIAIYPLYLKKIGFGYELRFIGNGEPEHVEVCSEFQDFIVAPEFTESLALFTEQVKQLKQCYRISFDKILPDSLCYKWLKHYQTLGWHYREQYIGKRFILCIADDEQAQITLLAQATLRRQARRFILQLSNALLRENYPTFLKI